MSAWRERYLDSSRFRRVLRALGLGSFAGAVACVGLAALFHYLEYPSLASFFAGGAGIFIPLAFIAIVLSGLDLIFFYRRD